MSHKSDIGLDLEASLCDEILLCVGRNRHTRMYKFYTGQMVETVDLCGTINLPTPPPQHYLY